MTAIWNVKGVYEFQAYICFAFPILLHHYHYSCTNILFLIYIKCYFVKLSIFDKIEPAYIFFSQHPTILASRLELGPFLPPHLTSNLALINASSSPVTSLLISFAHLLKQRAQFAICHFSVVVISGHGCRHWHSVHFTLLCDGPINSFTVRIFSHLYTKEAS